MKASEHNINTLMLSLHEKIEKYSDHLASSLDEGHSVDHVTYPPNNGFTATEIESLTLLSSNEELKTALRKLVANSIAGVFLDFFNYIDGTGDPDESLGKWTEISIVDRTDDIDPPVEMLHDKFFDSYWDWRKMRENKIGS